MHMRLWYAGIHQTREGHHYSCPGFRWPLHLRTCKRWTRSGYHPLGLYDRWGCRNRCRGGRSDRRCVVPHSTPRRHAHRCLSVSKPNAFAAVLRFLAGSVRPGTWWLFRPS